MKKRKVCLLFVCQILILVGISSSVYAVRTNKMPDVDQEARADWGENWCAPTAVGNSFAWLAKEYPELAGLARVNGTGGDMSAESIINVLGKVDMDTDPDGGTSGANILKGKLSYIKRHGLEDKITVETKKFPTHKWLKEQYDKGQDVELGLGYYEKDANGDWEKRVGGHVVVYGVIPGELVGGHTISLADISDPNFTTGNFTISFTDPGRNDVAGEYGAIDSDQYVFVDTYGVSWPSTASTYNVVYDPDPVGNGQEGLLLDGYQGAGDFAAAGPAQTVRTYMDVAWAESPCPPPAEVSKHDLEGDGNDSTGNGNDGTMHGNASFGPGTVDLLALYLDGDGDYLEIPDAPNYDFSGSVTLMGWANSSSFAEFGMIVSKGDSAYGLGVHNGMPFFGITTAELWDENLISTNQWHHIAGVYDYQKKMSLYIDGVKITSKHAAGSIDTNDNSVCIGTNPAPIPECNTGDWNGEIDTVHVFNYALTDAEVAGIYVSEGGWLETCVEHAPTDLSGPEGVPDCYTNIYDFVEVARSWLMCNDPQSLTCE